MNLNSLTSSLNSGFKIVETTVERQVQFVKTMENDAINAGTNVAQGAINLGGSVGEGVLNVGESVGKSVLYVGETLEEGAISVGEGVGNGAITVGKGALSVGETVGQGAISVGETVGKGVAEVGESALDCVNFIDGSVNNIVKLIRMCQNIYAMAARFRGYLEDDSLIESTLALTVWLALCYFFQIWMIPAVILVIYIKNLILHYIFGEPEEEESATKSSAKAKVEAIGEIIGLVRTIICNLESLLESIFGFIDFKSLHLSWIPILIQVGVTFILMFIPINYLLMLWGISLYTKKFLKNDTPTGEVPKNGGRKIVSGTEKLQGAAGDLMTLNFTKGFEQLKGAFGKLSKSD